MDSFSYYDISSVFLTKTIDRIVSPMAVQLCHLIISLECDGNKYTRISGDLEQMAEDLSKATEHFSNTSIRLGAECDDGILRQEMEQAAKTLLIIGKNFLLSVQKLIIQPTVRKHQEELVVAAQNILTGTLKLLQLEDDAGVRKIHQAADWLLECLKYLQKAESMSHLLSHFCEFSEALLLVNSLTERRILDLKDSLHQQHLSQTLQILRKCVPMLYTATQSNLKHPYNKQMIASKWYIFDLASKTALDLKCLLTTGPVKQEVCMQGSFSEELHHLLEILTNPKPTELNNSDLDFLVGAIIFYSMYVADCSRPNIKLRLVKHCQHLLEQRKRLWDHLKELQERPCLGKTFCELEQQCASMKVKLNHLNQTLLSTIFYQILDAFTVKDPLKRLLKAALKTNKKASLYPQNLFASKAFQPLLQAFQNHMDQLLKISSLVLAQCCQARNIEEIQSSVDCLCRVREEVVALVIDSNKAHYESKMFEKAQSIYQKWIQATESLMMSFDGMLTVHQFLELSIREIEENRYRCENLLRSQEPEIFQHHAADLCDLAERVAQVVNRHVDQSKDPIFRNGLRVLVRQLESSVLETRTAMIKCVESMSCLTTQKFFLEKVNNVFDSIHNVQEGVSGCKHPDLLSPLRNEAGPVGHKPMTIDLHEFEESKEDNGKTYGEHNKCLSYEGYLSKPLTLITSTMETIRNSVNIEKTTQVTDLQPLVGDLLIAITKQNPKEVHVCSSILIEISSIYLEAAKNSLPPGVMMENDIMRYKDTESLILSLLKLNMQGDMDPVSGMGKLIQTAILLSHRVEEIKTCLVSLANYWYNFTFQLFCTSTEVTTNVQIFNSTMQRLAGIVQTISEHLYISHDNLEYAELSGKQESLVKIHVKFSKCQATANQLLTKVLCHGMQSDRHKLEAVCILWSAAVQQLSKSVDDFIGISHLFMTESMDLTELNISENKSLVLLCETSLWLQEASTLSINNFTDEKEKEKVELLKEGLGSLTEAVLKVRDDLNMSSPPTLFLTVECRLLQKELMLKAKLLMHHMENLYRGNQTLIQRVVNFALSSPNSNDRTVIMGSFEKDAKLLVENVTLVKETLNMLCYTKKEDIVFLVEHLFFLTTDIIARTRLLIENQHQWDIFMLEAMYLNWSAKADQLILQLQSNTEMDVMILKLIKQCLRMGERTETPMTDNPIVLENVTSNTTQSVTINVREQRVAKESEQKTSIHREQDSANGHSINAVYKQIVLCGDDYNESNGSDKISSENNSISNEQRTSEGKQWTVLNNGQKTIVRKSIKVLGSKQEIETDDKHHKAFSEKQFKSSSVALEQRVSAKSNEPLLQYERKSVQMESVNQKTNMDPQVHKNAILQESDRLKIPVLTTAVQKEIQHKKSGSMTTQNVLTGLQKETANQEPRNWKTHTVLTGVQKETANQEPRNWKTHTVLTGVQKETANQEPRNWKTHTVLTGVQKETASQETRNQKTHTVLTGVQNETASQKTRNQKTHQVLNRLQKEISIEESMNEKTHTEYTGVQKEITNAESRTEKTHTEYTGIQKQITNEESRNDKANKENIGVEKEIFSQESRNQKTHNLQTGVEKETTNQVIKDHKTHMTPTYIKMPGVQTEIANQGSANQKKNVVLTRVATKKKLNVSISGNKIKCSQWHSASNKMELNSKGHMETVNQESINSKTDMTPNRGQKEINKEQKVARNQRVLKKMNTDQQETQNKQTTPYTLQKCTQYEKPQQGTFKREKQTSLVSQTAGTLNLIEMDSMKALVESSENPRNTTVIVEHQKINCTSLEDVRWQPHRVAKCLLAEEVETWEGETNTIVKITREMAAQMSYMMQYLNRKGPIQTPEQFIASAKCIAAHGQTFVKFVEIMAKNCTDTRNTCGLLCGMEQIQTISNQLNIVSSVKAATGCHDYCAEEVLLKNAQNLIHSILQTWKAAEAACIKGTENPTYSEEEAEVAAFCSQLRKKLQCQRAKESAY